MELKKIVAIVRSQVLGDVEDRLIDMRVKGISVTRVKGYGEYDTFINPDWIFTHARVEIYAELSMVDTIVETIINTAHADLPGDGIVAVCPVERLYRIRSKAQITADEI
ncbi:MAG: P-II family nitrogen regulator [Desulfuromonadaceae bacterium]|nr:P-II family nitrogen regulator [Desulfuromonadaceae bacterium]